VDLVPRPESFAAAAFATFFLALILRIFHLWQIRRAPFFAVLMGDSRGYDLWAQRIAGGDWLGTDVFYQAPLYPYFLGTIYALAGRDLLIVRLAQAIVGSTSCVLLGLAARRLWSRQAGLAAGLMLALYAPAIFFDGLIQKTVLDVFFVCFTLWLMSAMLGGDANEAARASDSKWTWLSLGLAMGGLALTRENAMVFIVVLLAWILVWRRPGGSALRSRLAHAAAFLLGLALVLAPVAVRNSVVSGGFYITTAQFGPNFYLGNNSTADGTAQSLRVGRGSAEYERQDATELAEHGMGRRLTPGEVSQYWTDRALGYITSQPGEWLKLMARKFALLWNATEMLDTESQESYADWSAPIRFGSIVGHFGVLVPLACLGIVVTWTERRRLWVLYAMIAAYSASVLLFFVYARYRFALVPFLVLFASAGVASTLEYSRTAGWLGPLSGLFSNGAGAPPPARAYADVFPLRAGALAGRHGRRRLLIGILLIAIVVFTNWPILSGDLMRAITEHNLGAALQSDGRLDEAIVHYRRALAFKADHAPALNNLGTAQAANGDAGSAIQSYERALAIDPGYASAHYNLANALLRGGNAKQAEEHFRLAVQSDPGSLEAHNNLGIALRDEGRFDEAIVEFRAALAFDPGAAATHRNLADALASAGRRDEAIQSMREAVRLDASNGPARYDLATLLVEAGQTSEAVAEFRAALALMPNSVDVLNNLGIALGSLGRLDEAIESFERALSVRPDFPQARQNLAAARQLRQQAAGPSRR
jgi:tetratricopeptide (TPR) repeat protein/4-amino-4-deoxy-L-arabinose transferase-like glycosyltransferase